MIEGAMASVMGEGVAGIMGGGVASVMGGEGLV